MLHPVRLVAGVLCTALAIVAFVPRTTIAVPELASARRMEEAIRTTPLPARDPVDLAIRLRGLSPEALWPTGAVPSLEVGQQEDFWIVEQRAAQMFSIRATLQHLGAHSAWYVQDDLADRAPQADLERAAAVFEQQTYPAVRSHFGPEPSPGVDGQDRVVLLLGNVPDVAAYFSGADSQPRTVTPRSNERDMIYVNLQALRPGHGSIFDSVLAHEFQHMVHFHRCRSQETWVDEGAAELATTLAGFGTPHVHQFARRPDVQLTAWTDQPGNFSRHYQAAYLFLRYVVDRFGGPSVLPQLLEGCERGPALFSRFLAQRAEPLTFDQLFADWAVANLLDDPSVGDGRYGHPGADIQVPITATLERAVPLDGHLPQYAANYVELPAGSGTVQFRGDPRVGLVGAQPPSGRGLWWSNRADSLDSRLTRHLDLRGTDRATLRARIWHDIEEGFDFAYLFVSTDGGTRWQALPGLTTKADDAVGNNFGPGWSGRSGGGATPVWVDEEVDLSAFAGSEILLRFEYLTDQGFNVAGFAFDDLHVPEIGLFDDAESDGGWTSEGWVRVDSPLPQQWLLRLVRWTADATHVEPVAVGEDGTAAIPLDPASRRSVLVVAPAAPRTLQPARYTLAVE